MFQGFENFFSVSNSNASNENSDALMVFRDKYQGKDFGEGIYRVFSEEEVPKWKEIISQGFPDFTNKFEPFAYDWLGRCFAIDLRKNTMGNILLFEIGTADVLEIPCDFVDFHNEEIPMFNESCLAINFIVRLVVFQIFCKCFNSFIYFSPNKICIAQIVPGIWKIFVYG